MRMKGLILALLCLAAPVAAGPNLPEAAGDLQTACFDRMAAIDNLPAPTLGELKESQALLKIWSLLGRYGGTLGKKDLALPVKALALVGRATGEAGILSSADGLLAALFDGADSAALDATIARNALADPAAQAKVRKPMDKALAILKAIDGSQDRGAQAKLVAKAVAMYLKSEALAKKLAG